MNNRQVAHVWAQQSAVSGKGSNFYFERETIYSYGSHFPIARFASPMVVLFTTRGYSSSTARHISYARYAISNSVTLFYVNDVTARTKAEHRKNFDKLQEAILSDIAALARKRSTLEETIKNVLHDVEKANAYSLHFKLARRIQLPSGISREELIVMGKKIAAANAVKDRRERKARDEQAAAAEIAREQARQMELVKWRRGEPAREGILYDLPTAALRLRGVTVETTSGAEFPASHAERAYRLLRDVVARGQEWDGGERPIRIGYFRVDHVDADGTVTAGCHRIRWEEVTNLAHELGM